MNHLSKDALLDTHRIAQERNTLTTYLCLTCRDVPFRDGIMRSNTLHCSFIKGQWSTTHPSNCTTSKFSRLCSQHPFTELEANLNNKNERPPSLEIIYRRRLMCCSYRSHHFGCRATTRLLWPIDDRAFTQLHRVSRDVREQVLISGRNRISFTGPVSYSFPAQPRNLFHEAFFSSICTMGAITHRVSKQTYQIETPPADAPIEVLDDFYWTKESEPHTLRRRAIMAKYPQVSKLTGYEPKTKWICSLIVALQFAVAYHLRNTSPLSWKFFLWAYIVGATLNQAIFLAIHELSHNLLFKKPFHNKIFAIFTNLPIGIPYSASFQPYHQLHHKFLGDEYLDTDLPTRVEGIVLLNVLGKVFFATCQIFFYALRPMFITQIKFTYIHLLNVIVQIVTDAIMIKYWGVNAFLYFIMSSFLAGSLHPCAGHFIAEHYVLNENNVPRDNGGREKGNVSEKLLPAETYSYYGSLNLLTWNVGYHNEHHDFPYIAWTKLPELRKIAAEFYEPLPQVKSWCGVLWYFCFEDINNLWCRVKRAGTQKEGLKIGGLDKN